MTNSVPVAATDGKNVLINPDTFFAYNLPERGFILAHEIVHNVYGDVELLQRCVLSKTVAVNKGKNLPFDNDCMQQAMDYRINALLRDSKIGTPPKDCLLDDKMATANDSVIDAYEKVYKKKQQQPKGPGGNQPGNGQSPFDKLLPPGAATGDNTPRNPEEWQVETQAAQTLEDMSAKRAGREICDPLKRLFEKLLNPEVPWTDHIRMLAMQRFGNGSYNWNKPDRQYIGKDIYVPSRSSRGSGWLAIWGDTSGSIANAELCRYMGELSGIIEDCRPRRLTALWCDNKIHRIDEITDTADLQRIKAEGVGGGGGTSIKPIMDWINRGHEEPEMLICFTDGYLESYPKTAPSFPVIWASTTDYKYPWGEVVRLKV